MNLNKINDYTTKIIELQNTVNLATVAIAEMQNRIAMEIAGSLNITSSIDPIQFVIHKLDETALSRKLPTYSRLAKIIWELDLHLHATNTNYATPNHVEETLDKTRFIVDN
jgi:uncharacterized protein YjfI (DUF2170 family)